MKRVISIPVIVAFLVSLSFVIAKSQAGVVEVCGKVSHARLAVNLRDSDCLSRAENGTSRNENNVGVISVVREINVDRYAVCLLKKASLMDDDGKVRRNFDIVKILEHLYERQDGDQLLGLALISRALQKCRRARGSDQFFKAANIVKCLLDNQGTTIRCAG